MKKKIAYLMEFPTISGGEKSLLELLRRIPKDEFEPVCILPPEGNLADAVKKLGIRVISYLIERNKFGARKRVELISHEIVRLLDKEKFDLIHANSVSMAKYTSMIKDLLKIPSIAHLRDIIKT